MQDIEFDITTREIVLTGEGDSLFYSLTDNPSVQNGGMALRSRCAFPANPMIGIGFDTQVMNGHPSDAVRELNRWKQAVVTDGATQAKWNAAVDPLGKLTLNSIEISYL